MSRCIDLFIDAPMPIEELAAALGGLSGVTFVGNAEGSTWEVRDGDTCAELTEHLLEDDGHLVLSAYRYDLWARVESGSVTHSAAAALLRRIFAALKADGRFPSLLVFDLQHVLDRADAGRPPT